MTHRLVRFPDGIGPQLLSTHLWRNDEKEELPNEYFSVHPENVKIDRPHDPASYAQYTGKVYSADHIDGISFLPVLKQQPQTAQHRFLYWERHNTNNRLHEQAVRFGDWKAIRTVKADKEKVELFNLREDPSEARDVSAKNASTMKKAHEYFQTRRRAAILEWNFESVTSQN